MPEARVARFRDGSEGLNTLAPSRGDFLLEIQDDARLPDGAYLVVEGLPEPLRLVAADHYDGDKGIYRFPVDDPPAGSYCSLTLEIGEESFVLVEDFDLHAYIEEASDSETATPPLIDIPNELFEHVREIDDDEVSETVPEDDEWEGFDDPDSDEEAEPLPEESSGDGNGEAEIFEEN